MKTHARSRAVPAILLTLVPLMVGCSSSSSDAGPTAGRSPSEATSTDPGAGDPGAPPHLVGNDTLLRPGTYQFSFATNPGVQTPDDLVDVPNGFKDGGDWYVVSPDNDAFLGMWTVGRVQVDACLRPRNDYFSPGPSVKDLAEALVAQKSTHASAPTPVVVAGYRGLYLELASPRDISRCDRTPGLWGNPGKRGIYSDAQIDRLWILDVDGQRLVVDAAHGPTATTSELEKLTSMVKSLEFAAASE